MTLKLSAEVRAILKKSRDGKYEEVVDGFLALSEQDRFNEVAMMAYADSLYELGKDVDSLDSYLKYISHYPNGRAVDVALFGAAMTLKNLDLQEEAFHVLQHISPEHNGLNEEIEHSNKILSEQAKAKNILTKTVLPGSKEETVD